MNRKGFGEVGNDCLCYATRHMFHKGRRNGHLALDGGIDVSITDSAFELVMAYGLCKVCFYFYINGEVGAHDTFLGHDTVITVETKPFDDDFIEVISFPCVFLECASHTISPCVYVLILKLERSHKFDDIGEWHTIAKYPADEFCVVPVFFVETFRKPLDSSLVATTIDKGEVIAFTAVTIDMLDDVTFGYSLWKGYAIFIVEHSCEYFIGIAIKKSYESHPFLFLVLKFHHITIKADWTFLCYLKLRSVGEDFIVENGYEFRPFLINLTFCSRCFECLSQFLFSKRSKGVEDID